MVALFGWKRALRGWDKALDGWEKLLHIVQENTSGWTKEEINKAAFKKKTV